MNKSKGFVDPFTLGFIVTLGIGGIGAMTDNDAADQKQLAQEGQPQTEIVAPTKEEPST